MNATTAYSAPTTPAATPQKDLEKEIKFSWRSVMRRWGENLKDDIDPALTGAKMAIYMHAIPTWHREYTDGKMRSSNRFITGLSALVVGGTEAAVYYGGVQLAEQQLASTGIPNIGYIAAGAALIATNTVAWGYEAFRKAKKVENSNVVMARIQRAMDNPSAGYDVSIADLHRRLGGTDAAKKHILANAYRVFDGLVADGQLGSKYEMTAQLETGPVRRKRRNDYSSRDDEIKGDLAKVILAAVQEKGGSASIELFGKMTALYDGEQQAITRYHVVPNKTVWR